MIVHTELGHVEVNYGGTSYPLIPSLSNISRIGSPKEIVEAFVEIDSPAEFKYLKIFDNEVPVDFTYAGGFATAAWVLECCGLPSKLTGWTRTAIVDGKATTCIVKGKIPVHDVFVLAAHCLRHGVLGVAKSVTEHLSKDDESVLTEFNPYQYIYMATQLFGCTLKEAGEMTMTQLLFMCKAKMDAERESQGKPKTKEDALKMKKEAFEWAKNHTPKLGKRIV